MAGGLSTPRAAAELQPDGSIKTQDGLDVSAEFRSGAQHALAICLTNNIKFALLKARSPSCGSNEIYDGSFSSSLKKGNGVTAELLNSSGIRVFTEDQIEDLAEAITD